MRAFVLQEVSQIACIAAYTVDGRLFGKESRISPVNKLRAVLPQPVMLKLYDTLISVLLYERVLSLFPSVPSCYAGAQPKTQPLDIIHGLQTALEKSLDMKNEGALGQGDIETFYDTNDILLVCQHLLSLGVDGALLASAIRLQMLPVVSLRCGLAQVVIATRAVGTLTGSTTAGVLGLVPVLENFFQTRSMGLTCFPIGWIQIYNLCVCR